MNPPAPAKPLASAALALARAFHRGATLWCWSPDSPSHAHHLAVEFVHPVIVGKRAFPALAVEPAGAAERLRRTARAGDVIAVIARGDDAAVTDVVRRAPAWGVDVIWLATGGRAPLDTRAQLAALANADDAAGDADIVCAYHLLWELTHACFDHPGLLEQAADLRSCPVCLDAGDLGEVEQSAGPEATVIVGGVRRTVDLSLLGSCEPGELVVVHAGVAITKLAGAGHG